MRPRLLTLLVVGVARCARGPEQAISNLPRATFRARLRAAAVRYGFRVVRVDILRPLQDAPLVVVQPDSKDELAASTRAILERLDPSVRSTDGKLAYAYEGFLFEAQDSHREPYVIVSSTWRRPNPGTGTWAAAGDFVPVPSAFPLR